MFNFKTDARKHSKKKVLPRNDRGRQKPRSVSGHTGGGQMGERVKRQFADAERAKYGRPDIFLERKIECVEVCPERNFPFPLN